MTALQWVAVEARTGLQIAELPGLTLTGPLKGTLNRYETATADVPVSPVGTPPPVNWLRATKPGATALVALDDDGSPVWGGYITQRTRSTDDAVTLSLASAESYLDRRYVGTVTYTNVGQNAIVADLIARYVVDGAGGLPGIPLRVQASGAGTLRTRSYAIEDDVKVYARLQQLAGVEDGIEFTIGWEWQHSPERLTPVLYVGSRAGTPAPAGLAPAVTFSLPGSVASVELVEDYSDGKGANDVTAVSSGQGDTRPTSGPVRTADYDDRPTYEYRWSPSTSTSDVSTLQAHAREALAILGGGAAAMTLTAAIQGAPRLGTDWVIGDDVGYDIDPIPSFPAGAFGVGRAIGWQLDLAAETVSPILAVAELATEEDDS